MEQSMKTRYSALAVAALAMTFNAAPGGVAQERIPELQRDAPTLPRNVTLTGCVARGTEPGTYTLTNITKAGDGVAKDAAPSRTVILSGTDVDISKHLDHMVAVTGPQALEMRAVGTTGPERLTIPDARKDDGKKTIPSFTVTSLKMVADSCAKPAL
jgi:hypothetical protein